MSVQIYNELEQGTEEWLEARRGILTASTIGAFLAIKPAPPIDFDCPDCSAPAASPCLSRSRSKGEPAAIKAMHSGRIASASRNVEGLAPSIELVNGDAAASLTARLVAERIAGFVEPSFTSADMQRGHDVEPIARDLYSDHFTTPVREVGFMVRTLPSGARVGWSPDGLVDGNAAIEIKAPRAAKHLLTILSDKVPDEHLPQCQTGLFVSGREWIDFVSYYGGLKPFVKRVYADPLWFDAIAKAVERFENDAAEMQEQYEQATHGLPATDRLPDPFDLGLVF